MHGAISRTPRAAPLAGLLAAVLALSAAPGWPAAPHLFQKDRCGACHFLPTREETFLRANAFRRDIASLCLECHESRRGGIEHRVGMAPSMRVPPDLPLDAGGRLTCATCHDPHAVDGPNPRLLRRPPGRALCDACHPEGLPRRAPPAVAFTFPPEGAVVANAETVVAGTVMNRALNEVRIGTGRELIVAPVIGGAFLARVRLAPGTAKVLVEAGGRRARLHLTVRPAAATWSAHLTDDPAQCSLCHPQWETRGFLVAGAPGETCQRCHDRVDTLPHRHAPALLGECTTCHDPHGTSPPAKGHRRGEGCDACHEPAAAAQHLLAANSGLAAPVTACGRCHDPHQSTRPALTTATEGSLALPLLLEAPVPPLRPVAGDAADLTLPGFALADDPGRPQLPERIVTLAVPPGADPRSARLRIIESDVIPLPGSHVVAPAPPAAAYADGRRLTDWGAGKRIRDGRDLDVYESDALWPPAPLALERAAVLGDLALVRVAYRPLQYRPLGGALTHTRRVLAEIQFDPLGRAARSRRSGPGAASATDVGVANPARAGAWSEAYRGVRREAASTPGRRSAFSVSSVGARAAAIGAVADSAGAPVESAAYLIVTARATVAASTALADFAAHKTARGLATRVVTEADFGAATAGRQRAEAIRSWLRANASALDARYLLLVGDPHPESGDVPMLRAWPRRGATTNTAYLDAPTDAFYADLSGTWDLDGDGYPGEFRDDAGSGGADFVPELFVGRIPVYGGDMASLDAILRKVIAYESAGGDLAWRRSVLLPMSFADPATDGAWLAEQMKGDFLVGRGFSPWSLYQLGSAGGAASVFAPDAELRGGAVAERWGAAPPGVVAWWGHGSPTRALVGYSGAWDGVLLAQPTTGISDATPAFVYQNACLNGYPESDTNLAYGLLRNGAIATVSASRVSWYAVGQRDFRLAATNAGLAYRYIARLTAGEAAGRALALAKGDPGVTAVSDTFWMNLMDFNLYGDPSVSLFPGPALQLSRGEIALTAAEGEEEPVGAAVALSSGDTAVDVRASAGAAWLGAAPLETRTPATLALSAFAAGLPPGVHATQVLLTSREAANAPIPLPVRLTVTRAGGIGGRVGDPSGGPVPGATVALAGARSRLATTDAAGVYDFAKLPPGGYTVEVSGSAYPLVRPVQSVAIAEGEQRTLNFLVADLAIRGRVTDAAGRPLPRVAVRLHDPSGVLLRETVTDARGAYAIARLGPGDYTLRARRRPWRFQPALRAVRITDSSLAGRSFVGSR